MTRMQFFHPETTGPRLRVHPVFLPFAGCPAGGRCIFCAQPLQTGCSPLAVPEVLAALRAEFEHLLATGAAPRELAFYGGTFTALPLEEQLACLDLAQEFRAKGLITRVRASTRPDRVEVDSLSALGAAGLDLVELGVQSFDDAALTAVRRGYDGATALAGCFAVREAGLALGVQLMPGMPGMDAAAFRRDMERTAEVSPETLRLYPCLVLAGTELARQWQEGLFTPWSLEETVPLLAEALLAAWGAGIRVIRMGLAPEPGLMQGGVLAGPQHPALGARARALALYLHISRRLLDAGVAAGAAFSLTVPRALSGEFWGHKGELKEPYAALGLTADRLRWRDDARIDLEAL